MADTLHKTHREKTTALQESIGNGRFEETALQYLSPFQYKQHNPTIASGRAAIFALHDQLPADTTRAHVLRAFQDGDYAFVHVDYDLGGPMVAFDIHRYQDGHAVEHWDNLQPKAATPNPSGHTMIDGATEIADLDRTHDNKLLVTRYIEDVIVRARTEHASNYFQGDRLIQHNPHLADGTAPLFEHLRNRSETGTRYVALHHILGEGNFVLAVCEAFVAGHHSAIYDLYRLHESKLAEHWDIIERIPPIHEWKNFNGKF